MPKLSNPADVAALERVIRRNQLQVVGIDPAYLALGIDGKDATNLFAMGKVLLELTNLTNRTGCMFAVNHHNRKEPKIGPKQDVASLDDMAFVGWAEWARQTILIQRRSHTSLTESTT